MKRFGDLPQQCPSNETWTLYRTNRRFKNKADVVANNNEYVRVWTELK